MYWQGERLEVAEILETLAHPDGKRFRVRTPDGQVFELVYESVMPDAD